MSAKPKYTPKRSPDQARITFSLPKSMLKSIDMAAKADRRSRSQWLILQLERIVSPEIKVIDPPAEKSLGSSRA